MNIQMNEGGAELRTCEPLVLQVDSTAGQDDKTEKKNNVASVAEKKKQLRVRNVELNEG